MQFRLFLLSGTIETMTESCLVLLKQKEKSPRNKKITESALHKEKPISQFLKRCSEILKILLKISYIS